MSTPSRTVGFDAPASQPADERLLFASQVLIGYEVEVQVSQIKGTTLARASCFTVARCCAYLPWLLYWVLGFASSCSLLAGVALCQGRRAVAAPGPVA